MTRSSSSLRTARLGLVLFAALHAPAGAQSRAFVVATDFQSPGRLADISFGPPRSVTPNVANINSDAVLRYHGNLLYVVNRRNADNIQVLDPANGFSLVKQFSVGNGSNPHDIELASPTKAYVTRYDSTDVWIVNPQTGAHTGTISLAAFADADGIPEMDHLALRDGRLFVSVQRLDRNDPSGFLPPTDSSQVVVIDVAADTLIDADPSVAGAQGILLPHQNPFSEMQFAGGHLIVACSGFFGVPDGGVVRIDPVTLTVAGTEVDEAALGGDLNDFAILDGTRGYAVVSDAGFNTLLKSYSRIGGGVTGTPFSTSGFNIADIEINDRSELWLCDRTASNPGVRVFDAPSGTQLTATPLSTGLAPADIAFDGGSAVGVPNADPPGGEGLTVIGAFPNPSRGLMRVRFNLGAPGLDATLEIVDVNGRRVRKTLLGRLAVGEHAVAWDGRDEGGEAVPVGVYMLRLTVGSLRSSVRVVRL